MRTRLLLIDDNADYCSQLAQEAASYGFEMVYFHNLEDGLEELISSRRIKAVILDGRCYIDPDQTSAARSNFVTRAISGLRDVESDYNRILPFCINTEHPADFMEDLEGTAPVFSKGNQHSELFTWIKSEIAVLPDTLVIKQYSDLFEVLENRFTDNETELLIDVIQAANSSDKALIITSMAILRRLLEKLMDIASIEILGKQPETYLWVKSTNERTENQGQPANNPSRKANRSRTRQIIDELHPRHMPVELYHIASELYKIYSKHGNHSEPLSKNTDRYVPGKYMLKRLVFGFAEIAMYISEKIKSSYA